MSIIDAIRKFLEPRGPLAEVLSPSIVYKTRAGLPIATAHSQRVSSHTTAEVQRFIVPARFVRAGEIAVPESRMRLVSPYVEEHYAPVYATTDSLDLSEILRASQELVGWNVTQTIRDEHCDCLNAVWNKEGVHEQCGRARASLSDEQFVEHVARVQLQASDEFYNGFYETIPGSDSVLTGAGLATGGTRITRGRTQYNQKTKGWVHWDKGVVKEREKAYAAEQQKWIDDVRPRVEKVSKTQLPRRLGEL
jgi:hypothetical protein